MNKCDGVSIHQPYKHRVDVPNEIGGPHYGQVSGGHAGSFAVHREFSEMTEQILGSSTNS